MTDFIVVMDNYCTLPHVITKLHDLSIGCIWTVRFCNGWPSKELRDVNKSGADFNDFVGAWIVLGHLLPDGWTMAWCLVLAQLTKLKK
eukprot:5013606-Ditylum_brightwellii.AAC.1